MDNAGNSPAEARDLGVLGANRTLRDFVGDGSLDVTARGDPILGVDDIDDYYRFTLGNNGPYAFSATISGLTGNADLQLSRDVLPSPRVDGGKVLATSSNTGTASDSIGLTLDRPGVYYLHVFRPGNGTTGSANYTLNMSAVQPPDSARKESPRTAATGPNRTQRSRVAIIGPLATCGGRSRRTARRGRR